MVFRKLSRPGSARRVSDNVSDASGIEPLPQSLSQAETPPSSPSPASPPLHNIHPFASASSSTTLPPVSHYGLSNASDRAAPQHERPGSHYQEPDDRRSREGTGLPGDNVNGSNSNPMLSAAHHMPSHSSPSSKSVRLGKLDKLLSSNTIDVDALRNVCWSGVPQNDSRPRVWRILCGFAKADSLQRKRSEYAQQLIPSYYHDDPTRRSSDEEKMWHQISIDVPRTCTSEPVFRIPRVALALQRILYIWALKHPASGYVQGINDLVTPFIWVFVGEHIAGASQSLSLDVEAVSTLSEQDWLEIEADAYWCFTKFADPLAEHYTFAQPGIQKMVYRLEELVRRLDAKLHSHIILEANVQFLQFAFRWCNCLLLREWSLPLSVRLFDTYISEGPQFSVLHVYVCAAFLTRFSTTVIEKDSTECVMYLQNLPTSEWTVSDIDMLTSQAYVWKCMFEDSPSHLSNPTL
ncbi:putative GTPase-activating protein Gyp1 [Andalucia godoyi]|uniref:Putative GTPase-activating protein Gyp1 n=1 Tax=Andalucia godoyi TaxID=505711 RepID=A0A8K0AID6_ANDGO|nr:putative GTPase-activating protein Gyp1 [Andalucia godoyi]|eukprot:ANDGO_08362.mRNA.1 putative GTPase-activating protein Gyp1